MRRAGVSAVLVTLASIAGAAVFLVACQWKFPPPRCGFVEDTYISFRYARNLAEGHGLVWNVGEKPVEGFTNLLWVVMLAGANRSGLFSMAGVEPELAAGRFLGLIHGVLTIAALTVTTLLLSRRRYRWIALFIPFHFALHPYFLWASVSGMETSQVMCFVAVLMLLGAVFLKRPGRPAMLLVSAWGAIGGAIRPDLVILVGVFLAVLAFVGVRRQRLSVPAALLSAFALPGLAGLALLGWKLSYFGTVVSPPLLIKGSFLHNLLHPVPFSFHYVLGFLLLAVPYFCMVALAGIVRRRPPMVLAGVWLIPAAAYAGYFLTVVPIMGFGYRYLMPLWGMFAVLAFLSLAEVLNASKKAAKKRRPLLVRTLETSLVLLLAAYPLNSLHGVREEAAMMDFTCDDLREIGRFLGTLRSPEDLCLAATECGNLPYFSRWKTVDLLGLNDAEIARHAHAGDFAAELVMRHRPDVMFLRDRVMVDIAGSLRAHAGFAGYRPVGRWRIGLYEGPIVVNTRSSRLNDFLGFFEFRWEYLREHPEDAVFGQAHKYVEAFRMKKAPDRFR